ncbi:MAG: hypothetical protein LBQ03_01295 [Puniceicoccales bacterium]|nr:hypothetical protein [Puniceicoccales bacterium]
MKIKFITRNPLTKTFCFLSGIIWTTICLDSLDKIIYIRDFKLPIIAFIIYGIIGFVGQSTLMWTYALLSLGLSIGIYSLRDELRNFDSNFALLGVILILFSCAFTFLKKLKIFAKSTFVIGLLYSLGPILILRRILTPFELVFLLIAINMIPLIMIKMKKS